MRYPKAIPFVKWAGGKRWLTRYFPLFFPKHFKGTYAEPFVGGGSSFFRLQPNRAVLSDINEELINLYVAVRDSAEDLIEELSQYEYDKEFYYQIRANNPDEQLKRAARILYLNKTCWNGLYRVNQQGQFNVPYGRYTNPVIYDEEKLIAASKLLQGTSLRTDDFANVTSGLVQGDFVYFDPPYVAQHTNNGFSKYNSNIFSWQDQCRLAETIQSLIDRGVFVLLSNTYHPSILELYKDLHVHIVERASRIAGDVKNRRRVRECLLSSYPLTDKV